MKYFAVADVHGFLDEMLEALCEKGFNEDEPSHKLLVCGDLMDRGKQAKAMEDYILKLLDKDKVILVRGNHEDLMLDFCENLEEYVFYGLRETHHYSNGTIDTATQLTGCSRKLMEEAPFRVRSKLRSTPFVKDIIPLMKNYYELGKYIFVHGYLPYGDIRYDKNWRNASNEDWEEARWLNGMECAVEKGIIEPDKTIVFGHWHCSFGHSRYEGKGKEFASDSDFFPFYYDGIIAIDAATAFSKRVNCLVIEE